MLPAEKSAIFLFLFLLSAMVEADEEQSPIDDAATMAKYEHAFHPKNDTAAQSTVPRKGVVHESQLNGTDASFTTPEPCKWPSKCPSTTPPTRQTLSSAPSSIKVMSTRRHKPMAAVDDPNLAPGANSTNSVLDDELPVKFPSKALPYVVGALFSLAIVALLVVGVYKCVAGKFTRGQYRKVDFLIDGMYDT